MDATGIWVTILIVFFLLGLLYQSVAAIRLLLGSIIDKIRVIRRFGMSRIPIENRVLFTFAISLAVVGLVGDRTLIRTKDLAYVYVGVAALGVIWSWWKSYSSAKDLYHGIVTGVFGLGPAALALLLLLNLIPRAMTVEEHPLASTGMKCSGIWPHYGCIVIMNLKDGAFSEWDRARTRSASPISGTSAVRFTIGEGLLGARVIFSRTDLAADGNELH
ncbi:MAG: hypothetical protein IPN38_11180 [Flavobacteriales bacterium]|nr:hypothetical protein [Flavobacteriales bacterium]MBL0036803.1 hypothetical protein [Flavobacteriales bacterium]